MYLPTPHAARRPDLSRRYVNVQDPSKPVALKPDAAPRRAAAPCRSQCVLRLVQRATASPVTAPSAEEPLLFEACSAMVLECWRRGLRVSVPCASRFELEVPVDAEQALPDIVQSLHPCVQQWNQRLREGRWQLVLGT